MNDKLFTIFSLNFDNYLLDKYFINLCNTCKELNTLLDETMYHNLLVRKFSNKFVNKARPIIISWKDCYSRIITFELQVIKCKYNLWTENNYFQYWDHTNYLKRKLKKY